MWCLYGTYTPNGVPVQIFVAYHHFTILHRMEENLIYYVDNMFTYNVLVVFLFKYCLSSETKIWVGLHTKQIEIFLII